MESQDAAPAAGVPQNTPGQAAAAADAAHDGESTMAAEGGVAASSPVRMYVGDDPSDGANCDNESIPRQDCDSEKVLETVDPLASATDGEVTPAQTPRGVTPIPEGPGDHGVKLGTKSASSSNLKRKVRKKKTLSRRAKSNDSLDSLGESDKGHSKLRKIKKINKECPLHGSQDFLEKIKAGFKAKEIVDDVLKKSKEDAADSGVEDGGQVEKEVPAPKPLPKPLSKEDCLCRVVYRSQNADDRPEPEGGVASEVFPFLHEYDKVIYSNEPLFSDEEECNPSLDEQVKQEMHKYHQRNPHADVFTSALMLNTNTMFRFAVIATELQNIINGSLKRAEGEVQALTRRIRLLEEDYEQTETRLQTASEKLEEASKAADESERGRKVLENRSINDEERIAVLEKELEDTIYHGEEADHKYEEAARKLAVTEVDLERAEARLEAAEAKIKELEEELHVVTNNLRSLEISEDKASQREDSYEETIRDLTARLKDAENRATEAERTVSKLQKEVDRLEEELLDEKMKYKALREEMEVCFQELQVM